MCVCVCVWCTAFTGDLVVFISCLAGNEKNNESPCHWTQFCVFTHRAVFWEDQSRSLGSGGQSLIGTQWIGMCCEELHPGWSVHPLLGQAESLVHICTLFCPASMHFSSKTTLRGQQALKSAASVFESDQLISQQDFVTLEDLQVFRCSWWEAHCFFQDLIFPCWPRTATCNCCYDHLPDYGCWVQGYVSGSWLHPYGSLNPPNSWSSCLITLLHWWVVRYSSPNIQNESPFKYIWGWLFGVNAGQQGISTKTPYAYAF